jgi:2-oxoglutarate/2-oxoacid ferredoxin oxidoreductase subunit beta
MRSAEVYIDKKLCLGCGYCVHFCPQGYLQMDPQNLNNRGFAVPISNQSKRCTACGACLQMCPHWAIRIKFDSISANRSPLTQPSALQPPLAGCAGCQHPTVGQLIAEAITELKCQNNTQVFESIPCSISSVFGPDFGTKIAYDENLFDFTYLAKQKTTGSIIIAIQGYWGQADFSFNIGRFINALIRGDKISVILCNTPYFGTRNMRPAPLSEPVEGQLEPLTQIQTPAGSQLIRGGYPLHLAEMVATFEGVSYVARGSLASVKDYYLTKSYILKTLQKQIDGSSLGFVEILNACCDQAYSSPVDCLKWIEKNMTAKFPLGEIKNK